MIEVDFTKLSKQRYAVSHDWDIYLPLNEEFLTRIDIESVVTGNDIFRLHCKSTTIPTTQVTSEQVTVYGRTTNVVTSAKANGNITLTFLESDKYELYLFFAAWRDMGASSRTDAISYEREDITVNGAVLMLSPEGTGHIEDASGAPYGRLGFILNGVQPVEVNLSQPSNNKEFMTLTVTLKYDDYRTYSLSSDDQQIKDLKKQLKNLRR